MRCLIVGPDDAGRSCVLEEREVSFGEIAPGPGDSRQDARVAGVVDS